MRSILVLGVSAVYMSVLPFFATLTHNGIVNARAHQQIATSAPKSGGLSVIYKTPFSG